MVGALPAEATGLLDSFRGEQGGPDLPWFESTYDDLRRLAGFLMDRQPPGQTLQATALLNEAYMRLVGGERVDWSNRRHFINTVTLAMRQVLVDRARRKAAEKRGGGGGHVDIGTIDVGVADRVPAEQAERVEQAVGALEQAKPRWGEIVRLRFHAGLTIEQTAQVMSISPALVSKDWRFARAWLAHDLMKTTTDG